MNKCFLSCFFNPIIQWDDVHYVVEAISRINLSLSQLHWFVRPLTHVVVERISEIEFYLFIFIY